MALDNGDMIKVMYSLTEVSHRGLKTIAGSIANLDLVTESTLVGATVTLVLEDGRKLKIIINKPSRFVGTGSYF